MFDGKKKKAQGGVQIKKSSRGSANKKKAQGGVQIKKKLKGECK
jgi:hypothetical protein